MLISHVQLNIHSFFFTSISFKLPLILGSEGGHSLGPCTQFSPLLSMCYQGVQFSGNYPGPCTTEWPWTDQLCSTYNELSWSSNSLNYLLFILSKFNLNSYMYFALSLSLSLSLSLYIYIYIYSKLVIHKYLKQGVCLCNWVCGRRCIMNIYKCENLNSDL